MPLLIIFCALVALFAAACGGDPNKKTNNGVTTKTPGQTVDVNAPPGAAPPNMLGSPTATVTLEEFADFQCPSCGDKHPVMKQIQSVYGSRIKFIFRNFPLQMHDKAYDAAVASEAAGIQGKFWDMHNLLYTNQAAWSSDPNYKQVFRGYAEKIGLDVDKWENDMAGMSARGRIQADMDRGKALQLNSTPTVFINGKSVPYPDMKVDTMRQLIEDELKATQAPSSAPPASSSSAPAANNSNK